MIFLFLSGLIWTAQAETPTESSVSTTVQTQTPTEPSPPPAVGIQLIYTGNLKGMARAKYRFPILEDVKRIVPKDHQTKGVHGILAQKDVLIHTENHQVDDLISFLEDLPIDCEGEIQAWRRHTPTTLLLHEDSNLDAIPPELIDSKTPLHSRRWCRNSAGKKAILWSPKGQTLEHIKWELAEFEFRKGIVVSPSKGNGKIHLIGKPLQSSSRIVHQILKRQQSNPKSLYVDSGNFLDGASSVKHGLSMHRPIGIEALKRLQPSALSMGENELMMGAKAFMEEIKTSGLPYVATNWSAKEPNLTFPKSITVKFKTESETITAAFLGIIDPDLHNKIPDLEEEGIDISDPVQAAQAEIDRLTALDAPPNVIILLTSGNSEVLHQLRRHLKGADLALGDPTMATLRIEQRTVSLKEKSIQHKAAPLTLPMDGLSVVELNVNPKNKRLRQIVNRPVLTPSSTQSDAVILEKLTQNRSKAYLGQSTSILTPPKDQLESQEWRQLICSSFRQHVNADTALLRPLEADAFLPGSISQKDIAESLAVLDEVEIHWIPGANLVRFLDQVAAMDLISCGAKPGAKKPKAKGRLIDPSKMYAIATTDRTRLSSALKIIIPAHQRSRVFDQAKWLRLKTDKGNPLLLRDAVTAELKGTSTRLGKEKVYQTIAIDNEANKPPITTLRVRELGLSAERFQGAENDAYVAVPETLINAPSSSTLRINGDVALEYSSKNINNDLRFQAAFGELTTNDSTQEVSDDWQLSTSLSMPGWAIGNQRWMPYGELSYDSEFTPTEQDDGSSNPLQSDLSLTFGYTLRFQGAWKNIKLGILANRDISQLDEKPTEFASRLQWETRKALFPHLIWTTNGDFSYFLATNDDDASDLSWRLWGETKLSLPLTRYLAIAVYAQGLGVVGRIESTEEFAGSWNLGCALDLSGAFDF